MRQESVFPAVIMADVGIAFREISVGVSFCAGIEVRPASILQRRGQIRFCCLFAAVLGLGNGLDCFPCFLMILTIESSGFSDGLVLIETCEGAALFIFALPDHGVFNVMMRISQEARAAVGIIAWQNLQHSTHAGQLIIEQTIRLGIPKTLSQKKTTNAAVEPFLIRMEKEREAVFIPIDRHHNVLVEVFHLRRIGQELEGTFRLQQRETAAFLGAEGIFLTIGTHGLTSIRFQLVAAARSASCSISSA